MFESFRFSVLVVALLALAALPAYPQTETASVKLRPAEVDTARTLLGENLSGPSVSEGDAEPSAGALALSVPRLGLENVPVPVGNSQVELDREGIIRLKEGGAPWKEGSNTTIVGHRLGYFFTKRACVFYELDEMKPGDELTLRDYTGETYTFRVYDRMTVRPEDYWVTYPVPGKTVVSLQTCDPIPTFENRLIVRAELIGERSG